MCVWTHERTTSPCFIYLSCGGHLAATHQLISRTVFLWNQSLLLTWVKTMGLYLLAGLCQAKDFAGGWTRRQEKAEIYHFIVMALYQLMTYLRSSTMPSIWGSGHHKCGMAYPSSSRQGRCELSGILDWACPRVFSLVLTPAVTSVALVRSLPSAGKGSENLM